MRAFGSATALRADVDRLRRRADAAERLARAVRGTDVGSWTGEAADACAEAMADAARNFLRAADDALGAASAMDRHAAVVEWADERLAAAVPTSAADADELLDDLRTVVDRSARSAAAALDAIADGIERMPDVWDLMRFARERYWGGIGDTLGAMVENSWQVQLFRQITDPAGQAAEQQAMSQALWAGLREDPVGLAKDMADWDTWRTDPLRALGRQVPDIIVSAATAGTGTAAAAGARVARSAEAAGRASAVSAKDLARPGPRGTLARATAAGHDAAGQRSPGWMTPEGWPVPEWLADAARRIPEEWGVGAPNKKGIGFRWYSPDYQSHGVRVDEGHPSSPFPTQQIHHVVVRKDGAVLGRDGLPLTSSVAVEAERSHIPLSEWMTWSDWGTP
ncbi:putative T7SS-secreted protein [Actinotalea ferrariae]|uniref:putative T7SS-secreted protein n=1 Tax=Actinotalea ferrariae TaxID=1386098 RepID=UPI0035AC1584